MAKSPKNIIKLLKNCKLIILYVERCELCNLISMICLQKEKYDASLDFLKKAEILCQNSLNYKAITYNNMACYYRKTDKLRTAL